MIGFPGLQAIQDPEAHELFMGELLEGGGETFSAVLEYHQALTDAMVDTVGDKREIAAADAASAIFGGLARILRQRQKTEDIDTIDAWAANLRGTYELRVIDSPRSHSNPIVAAFFTQLEPHLLHALPGDRSDTWYHDGSPPDVEVNEFNLEDDEETPPGERWWEE